MISKYGQTKCLMRHWFASRCHMYQFPYPVLKWRLWSARGDSKTDACVTVAVFLWIVFLLLRLKAHCSNIHHKVAISFSGNDDKHYISLNKYLSCFLYFLFPLTFNLHEGIRLGRYNNNSCDT